MFFYVAGRRGSSSSLDWSHSSNDAWLNDETQQSRENELSQ